MKDGFQFRVVKDFTDMSFAELRKRVGIPGTSVVRVGLPDKPHKVKIDKDGKHKRIIKGIKKLTLAMLGAIHEFGVPERGIPERPFLRPGIRAYKSDLVQLNRINLLKVVNGRMTIAKALQQLGVFAVGAVQRYIRMGHFKPLKESTIKAKGSSKPLIDTAQMMQSVTFEVTGKENIPHA
jgi:hypothetical protein